MSNELLHKILQNRGDYGKFTAPNVHRILIDSVSAPLRAPLTVTQGRAAACALGLAALLRHAGYQVQSCYQLDEQDSQLDWLAATVWLHYLELCGADIALPDAACQGDYLWDIAASLHRAKADAIANRMRSNVWPDKDSVPAAKPASESIRADITAQQLVQSFHNQVAKDDQHTIKEQTVSEISRNIKIDLQQYGLTVDRWLAHSGQDNNAPEKESDDQYDEIIQVRAEQDCLAAQNTGSAFHTIPVARVSLRRAQKPVSIDAFGESFYSFRQLRSELGNPATSLVLLEKDPAQELELDLMDLSAEGTENPWNELTRALYQIDNQIQQYHLDFQSESIFDSLNADDSLPLDAEWELINTLGDFPERVESATRWHKPHQLACFLRDLTREYQRFCELSGVKHGGSDPNASNQETMAYKARACLDLAVKQVMENGLILLGIKPETDSV